jgi:intracellular multiplication protein IcmB
MSILSPITDFFGSFLAWMSTSLGQTTASYSDLQTADSPTVLVNHDGSLLSVIRVDGVKSLIGKEEFEQIQSGFQHTLQTTMSQAGRSIQVYFSYNRDEVKSEITDILAGAQSTADRLSLRLEDLFAERVRHLSRYCAHEETYLVLCTGLKSLTGEQVKRAKKEKTKTLKELNVPPFLHTQNILAAVPDLRESHDSFVRSVVNDFSQYGLMLELLEVHDAVHAIRHSADPEFTAPDW